MNNDLIKFELARKIHKNKKKIINVYETDLLHKDEQVRQHAVATYLIDKLCLRCGNDENKKTYGCTTLQCRHIKQIKGNKMHLYFEGKDSIVYDKQVQLSQNVITNIKQFILNKSPKHNVFHKINSNSLNSYLDNIYKGLTAKVFRTSNASAMINNTKMRTLEEMKNCIERVAEWCNHITSNTTITNYIDPRIIIGFGQRENIDIRKIYSKNQIEKFQWAIPLIKENKQFKF